MESESTTRTDTQMSAFQKVVAVFTSPGKAFASIDVKPQTIIPIVIICAISIAFVIIAGDVILNETITQQESKMQEQGMTAEQIDQALDMTRSFMKYTTPLFAIIMPIVIIAIVAGIFLFVGNVILGGKSNYKKVFSVTAWSWLILSASSILVLPLVLQKQTMNVSFSLATFMSDEAKTTFLYQLLQKVDIFFIAWIAVYSIGLAVIYKMETRKTAAAVTVVYVLYAVIASYVSNAFA